ncbi:MAG: hypothetical protein M3N19_02365, partial [Candidatus Eremiobacteraeota bacterium]|nr:hypothetical protein [Candidatus Eremiobacteraeota bacterium]
VMLLSSFGVVGTGNSVKTPLGVMRAILFVVSVIQMLPSGPGVKTLMNGLPAGTPNVVATVGTAGGATGMAEFDGLEEPELQAERTSSAIGIAKNRSTPRRFISYNQG